MKFNTVDEALAHAFDYITSKDVEITRTFAAMRDCGMVPPDSLNLFTAGWWAADVLGLRGSPEEQLEMGLTLRQFVQETVGTGPYVAPVAPLALIMTIAATLVLQWPKLRQRRAPIRCPGKKVAALN